MHVLLGSILLSELQQILSYFSMIFKVYYYPWKDVESSFKFEADADAPASHSVS